MKKLIVFDLDGTPANSKSALDAGMASLFPEVNREGEARENDVSCSL